MAIFQAIIKAFVPCSFGYAMTIQVFDDGEFKCLLRRLIGGNRLQLQGPSLVRTVGIFN
jgi:hypothetical protein